MISMEGRKIVLIGGAGFIGTNLAVGLARQGAEVHVIDGLQVNNLLAFSSHRPDMPHRELYLRMIQERLKRLQDAGIPLYIQDARDYLALGRILNGIMPQVIIQLAAVAHADRSNKDPFSTFDHSLRTLENALDHARDNIEHFVYFSSSMVYGNFRTPSVDENHPLDSVGIYGALKAAGERIVIAYQQVFDLPFTIVRPSALYGPGCVSRRVAQVFIESAMRGEPLRISNGGAEKLDFTYVDDLVEGVSLALRVPAARNEVFNLTYGEGRSIRELADLVKAAYPGTTEQSVQRDNLIPVRGTLSIEKARRLLGYAPKTPLEAGIPKYIEWYKNLE